MKHLIATILIAVVAFAALVVLQMRATRDTKRDEPKRKRLLTAREQAMFARLATTLPDHYVLAQVSFGALLTARHTAVRNRFDRKIADFVVCDAGMRPLAVIELDDWSHDTKQAADANRDAMLTAAGYRVLRYREVPDVDQVLTDFRPQGAPK